MIKYNPKSWAILFLAVKGNLLRRLMPGLLLITAITVVACTWQLVGNGHKIFMHVSNSLPGYMGAALGLLLVFRNNTAYDKWWEARKEIGGLVNVTRNMAISLNGFLPHDSKEKFYLANLVSGFAFAMKGHLRNHVKLQEMEGLNEQDMETIKNSKNKPTIIANIIMSKVEDLWKNKLISDIQQQILVMQINTMVDILGKCERIRNTPIPFAYAFLLKFFIILYVLILPFGLLEELRWAAIPLVVILYFILMSIVLTAEEIEEPFGKDLNDLPMEELTKNIKNNVQEIVTHH